MSDPMLVTTRLRWETVTMSDGSPQHQLFAGYVAVGYVYHETGEGWVVDLDEVDIRYPTEAEARAALLKMAREDLEGDTHDR